jgi:hypothetical protein
MMSAFSGTLAERYDKGIRLRQQTPRRKVPHLAGRGGTRFYLSKNPMRQQFLGQILHRALRWSCWLSI